MRHLFPVLLCLSVLAPLGLVRVAPAHAAGDRVKAKAHYEQGEKYHRQGALQFPRLEYTKCSDISASVGANFHPGHFHHILKGVG